MLSDKKIVPYISICKINKSLTYELINAYSNADGRYILLNISIENNVYTVTNVYANNDKNARNNFYSKLPKTIVENAHGYLIIGGDMNDILDISDRHSSN